VATDSVTASNQLQYKLVKASSSAAIDTVDEVNALSGASLVMNWSTNALTFETSNLNAAETYFFAVLVRNNAGEMAIYPPQSITTLASDLNAPIAGGGGTITSSSITTSGVTLSWTRATDLVTSQPNLQYKLVSAAAAADIDTIQEIDAIAGSSLAMDWTADIATRTITGLSDNTTYYFALAVRDSSRNYLIYTIKDVDTLEIDVTAPVAGASGILTYASVGSGAMTVNWTAASDNLTSTAQLQYKLVKALQSVDIDSIAEADSVTGANLLMDWTANTLTKAVTGLSPSTTYHFVVLVKDSSSNKTLYTVGSRATNALVRYIYSASGAAVANVGLTGLDARCNSNGNRPDTSLTYKALISKVGVRIACTASSCSGATGTEQSLDWVLLPNTEYRRENGTSIIGTTNANAIFDFPLTTALHATSGPWTGLFGDWTVADNCNGWTSNSSSDRARVGNPSSTGQDSISGYYTSCDSSSTRVLCVSQ
jgi:hypothetical protein